MKISLICQSIGTLICVTALAVFLMFGMAGCLEQGGPTTDSTVHLTPYPGEHVLYTWGFANASSVPLDDVGLDYTIGDWCFNEGCGVLPVNNSGGPLGGARSGTNNPIAGSVNMRWRTPDGKTHFKEISIAGKIPDEPRFKGTIWFKYTGGEEWVVEVVTKAESFDRAVKGLSEVP